jgi:hypothetical protein
MRRICFLFILILSLKTAGAQTSLADMMKDLNRNITLYSADDAAALTLYEPIGTIEQKRNENSVQRFKLDAIGSITVEKNEYSFTVNIHCADSGRCISLVKSDMSTSLMPSDAFFFTEAKAANAFAKGIEALIARYPSVGKPVQVQLLKGISEPTAANEKAVANVPSPKTVKNAKEKEEEDVDEDAEDNPKGKSGSKTALEKSALLSEGEAKERAMNKRKPKEVEEKVADDEETETKVVREKAAPLSEAEAKERAMNRRKPKEKEIADESEEEETPVKQSRAERPPFSPVEEIVVETVCKQLMSIVKAGKDTKFKEIEGKETNPTTKINESKIKLKDAKRSYLSWYKKERAFIAEFKTLSDHDLILEEFFKLQTELEDCLEGPWEDTDHSTDEMYANATEDVKDVEYKLATDPQRPGIRILINTDQNKKYTLFVRIQ